MNEFRYDGFREYNGWKIARAKKEQRKMILQLVVEALCAVAVVAILYAAMWVAVMLDNMFM